MLIQYCSTYIIMSSFNNTSYCSLTILEYSAELLEAVNVYLVIVQGIVVSGIALVGAILTVSLMMIIVMSKELHNKTFILSFQLMLLDVGIICFVYGPMIITSIAQKWVLGSVLCRITGAVSYLTLYWRCCVIFVLILDRFLTVFYPFLYKMRATKVLLVVSVINFALFFILVIIPASETGCYEFSDTALLCVIRATCSTRKYLCDASKYVGYLLFVSIGGFIPVSMYIAMYIKARRMNSRAPQLGECEGESNKQEQLHNQRAKITIIILFVCLICLILPNFIRFLITPFIDTFQYYHCIYYIFNNIFFSFPIADSVIIWRNKDIKDKAKELFKKNVYCINQLSV